MALTFNYLKVLMTPIGFPLIPTAVFIVAVIFLLWVDLKAHKPGHAVDLVSATRWSIGYVVAALLFAAYIYVSFGAQPASLFLSGYVMEKVLSVDNLAVFIAVFSYFKIKPEHQHKVLHWGVIGAFTFRLIFVAAGAGLMAKFGPWAEGAFALFIAYSAWAMWRELDSTDEDDIDFNNVWYIRAVEKIWPVTVSSSLQGQFFAKVLPIGPKAVSGKLVWHVTPLFLCMVAIEMMDVMFSFDSVPTIIAVTQDPFLVYTSMTFAILGLRSLFFVLSALMDKLTYLPHAIIAVLAFIAIKLGLHAAVGTHIDPIVSLCVVLGLLGSGGIASWISNFQGQIHADRH